MLGIFVGFEPAVVCKVYEKVGALSAAVLGAEHRRADSGVDVFKADGGDESPVVVVIFQVENCQGIAAAGLHDVIGIIFGAEGDGELVEPVGPILAGDVFTPGNEMNFVVAVAEGIVHLAFAVEEMAELRLSGTGWRSDWPSRVWGFQSPS